MTLLIIEITEDVNIVFLIMIAVLFAYGTGNLFTKSFFYSTIEMKKMPYVSKLMKDQVYKMKANDIFIYITTAENICIADFIPVVLDEKDYTLFGIVKTENLIKYFRNELKANTNINHKSPWVGKLEILMSIYTFLDEEVMNCLMVILVYSCLGNHSCEKNLRESKEGHDEDEDQEHLQKTEFQLFG